MTDDRIDRLARAFHELVTETASRQITREIAHLAEIDVDTGTSDLPTPPAGYSTPPTGVVVTTHVIARSRDIPAASTEMRVAIWAAEGEGEPALLLTRDDDDRTLRVLASELEPAPTDHTKAQVSDYVAMIIARMVTQLNVAMQRTYLHESDDATAEYTED